MGESLAVRSGIVVEFSKALDQAVYFGMLVGVEQQCLKLLKDKVTGNFEEVCAYRFVFPSLTATDICCLVRKIFLKQSQEYYHRTLPFHCWI